MDAEQIRQAKIFRQSGLFLEAYQFYQNILRKNPFDKLAKLGYAQCLTKYGAKENLKHLLYRAERTLFELIGEDYLFTQAHDELIFLGHRLNHLGDLSKYYNRKLKQYPSRDIYQKCIKKIKGVALLALPTRRNVPKKRSLFARIFFGIFIIFFSVILLHSIFFIKFRSLFLPSLLIVGLFVWLGMLRYLKSR